MHGCFIFLRVDTSSTRRQGLLREVGFLCQRGNRVKAVSYGKTPRQLHDKISKLIGGCKKIKRANFNFLALFRALWLEGEIEGMLRR